MLYFSQAGESEPVPEDAARAAAERSLALLESGLPRSTDPLPLAWLDRLLIEHERVLAALRWVGEQGDGARGMRLATGLLHFWSIRRHRYGVVAARARQRSSLRLGAEAAFEQQYPAMAALCEAARDAVTQIGARQRRAAALLREARLLHRRGEHAGAARRYAASLALYEGLNDDRRAALCRAGLLAVATALGAATPDQPPAAPASGAGAAERARLTRRERTVAALVAEGLTNREIAQRLVITESTASTHVVHILARLGFRTRAQIAAWATRHLDG